MQITINLRPIFYAGIFLAIVGAVFALIWPVYQRALENANPHSCQSNLKQVALGVMQYSQDWDDHYPLVNVHDTNITPARPLGWADALQPYLKSTQIFKCPQIKNRIATDKSNEKAYTDYWFNRNLAGNNESKISNKESIFLFGDGNDGTDATNARYSLSTLPAAWRKDKTSPAKRHLDGAFYAFSDGHVKWLAPKNVSTEKPNKTNATFRIR
jgi:hypothetical protein